MGYGKTAYGEICRTGKQVTGKWARGNVHSWKQDMGKRLTTVVSTFRHTGSAISRTFTLRSPITIACIF